jgi:hypothetical protein
VIAALKLSYLQCRLAATSLEIDGRAQRGAEAAVSGHVSEFVYAGSTTRSKAVSPKAILFQEVLAAIEESVAQVGLPATIAELRKLR